MVYRPSPELVAANGALVHFLKRHPDQRLTSERRESPADIAHAGDVGRQVAAPREEVNRWSGWRLRKCTSAPLAATSSGEGR
ncbi:MAG: hypothetical protein EOP24_27805 [Hyphomicrobiales bacterium]|nr:MAG: hypothetical protein EOP24_27805 [Hyphomicrobiales bacterium]